MVTRRGRGFEKDLCSVIDPVRLRALQTKNRRPVMVIISYSPSITQLEGKCVSLGQTMCFSDELVCKFVTVVGNLTVLAFSSVEDLRALNLRLSFKSFYNFSEILSCCFLYHGGKWSPC